MDELANIIFSPCFLAKRINDLAAKTYPALQMGADISLYKEKMKNMTSHNLPRVLPPFPVVAPSKLPKNVDPSQRAVNSDLFHLKW